jgi:anthranilate phosphoribosyltransferase
VARVTQDGVEVSVISPEQFGLERSSAADLRGGDALGNAEIVREILSGVDGPKRRIVLLNAAFALVAAGKAADVKEGIRVAAETIDSGRAAQQLERLVALTNEAE